MDETLVGTAHVFDGMSNCDAPQKLNLYLVKCFSLPMKLETMPTERPLASFLDNLILHSEYCCLFLLTSVSSEIGDTPAGTAHVFDGMSNRNPTG